MTQWIFSSDYCSCAKPIISQSNPGDFIEVRGPAFEIEEDDGVELPLPQGTFPLDRYQPKVKLGAGAAGTVYLSRDRLLGKKVAVKILNQLDANQLMAFQEEAKITSRLQHPNIISILDFGPTDSGIPYMVLEYVERAESLEQLIERNGPLDTGFALQIFGAVSRALAHAHHARVFHRDLKPSNVLLSISDEDELIVKLIDFGVAKVRFDSQESTAAQSLTLAGTPFYMAPEIAEGARFDERSEIYSLGCLMFKALTGRPPFAGETALETIAMHANQERPSLAKAGGQEYSRSIEKLVATCLKREPSERYSSAQAVAMAIEALIGNELSTTRTQTFIVANSVKRSSSPNMVSLSIVAIILIFFGAIAIAAAVKPTTHTKIKDKTTAKHPRSSTSPKLSKKAYKAIEGRGIETWFHIDGSEKSWLAMRPLSDEELQYLALKHRGDIKNLQLVSGAERITSVGWSAVASLDLRSLRIPQSTIRDKDVSKIAKMPELRVIDLSETDITDRAVKSFENTAIEDLNLRLCTNVTDACAPALASAKQLRRLDLSQTQIGDQTVKQISALNLNILSVPGCKVTDEGLASLAGSKSLKWLTLDGTHITEKGIASLNKLDLEKLSVESCESFNDACLDTVIDNHPNLEFLTISNTKVKAKSVRRIANLKKLQGLNLATLSLKDEDIKPLIYSLHLNSLDLAENAITDKSLDELAKMKSLKKLQVSGCYSVSKAAVAKLRMLGIEAIHVISGSPFDDRFGLMVGE
jgi:serine/threonine protein kinase/Ran GTPase-activating protein (RanGAP) involved in mRNA processing and transport